MAWGQEKGADFHISALRACQYEIFDFVPCSLPLKTLILLTFSCFLIRRRGIPALPFCLDISCFELNDFRWLLSQRVLDGFPDAIAGIGSAGNGIKIQILRSDQLWNELFCSPGIDIRRFSLF